MVTTSCLVILEMLYLLKNNSVEIKRIKYRNRCSFPENITSYKQLVNIDMNVPVPRNLNLLIVGDSISRYQYMSLVYFLKFGKWINMKHHLPPMNDSATETQNMHAQTFAKDAVHMGLVWKNFWNSKDDWSNYSSSLLSPFEVCDCFEPKNVAPWDPKFCVDNLENRYFREPSRNNSVTYMQKLGDINNYDVPLTFKSSWSLKEINALNYQTMTLNNTIQMGLKLALRNRTTGDEETSTELPGKTYITANWTDFIRDFVSNIEPKPKVFIFNQGLWKHPIFQEPLAYLEIIQAISNAGMVSIYKTTTKWRKKGKDEMAIDPYEKKICELVDFCLDLSWTRLLPEYLYADRAHFYEPVYSWFNMGLLNLTSSI